MNPVIQRSGHDCLRAAVATVLDRPYGHTPRVEGSGKSSDFWHRWARWARRQELQFVVGIPGRYNLAGARRVWEQECAPGYELRPLAERPEVWIACVNPRGRRGQHAVVMCHDRLAHDPWGEHGRTFVSPAHAQYGLWFEGVR